MQTLEALVAKRNNNDIERATDERTSQRLHLDWWAFIVAAIIAFGLVVYAYVTTTPMKADSSGTVTVVEKGPKGKGKTVVVTYDGEEKVYENLWPVFVDPMETISAGDKIGWKWSDKPLKIPFKEIVKPLLPKKKEG